MTMVWPRFGSNSQRDLKKDAKAWKEMLQLKDLKRNASRKKKIFSSKRAINVGVRESVSEQFAEEVQALILSSVNFILGA